MDHGASALPSTFLNFSSNSMGLDFMEKSVYQGCWWEVTDKFNFSEPEPVTFSFLNNTSQYSEFILPSHLDLNSRYQFLREETENFTENLPLTYHGIELHVADTTGSSEQPESFPLESSQSGERWSIDTTSKMKDRLVLVVEYLKDYVADTEVLIQIWVPTNKGGQNVLTTIDQPYSLNPNCMNLANYRNVSKTFHLTAEEDLKGSAGLPGRVFLRKLPEWTPDVRFFRSDECPRKNYAKLYNVSGCLALPVFEQDSGICLAVIEIVTTTQKISYHPEVEIVCKALEAADLRSSRDCFPLDVKVCNQFYQISVPEISEILPSICETFRLPLAITWAIHDRHGEDEHEQFPEKSNYFISTVDSACCVAETDLLGFYEACSEQYLYLDQGIVGKAFATNKQWFATDITSFSKTNYPLSHHARIFNLGAAVAIPLRNMYTGLVDYVVEIFLPRNCKDVEKQKQKWDLLPGAIQQACQSFHVILDKEVDHVFNDQVVVDFSGRLNEEEFQSFVSSPSEEPCQENSLWILQDMDMAEDKCAFVTWECLKQEPEDEFKLTSQWDTDELDLYQEFSVEGGDHSSVGQHSSRRVGDKRQAKTEKTITLQILRQYFSGSLKDAAKSIGVCPTTLKRICRKHGINRWPSRKIKKVNHSLRKLQRVVDSIRGAEGLIQIDSFYKTFPEFNASKSYNISDGSHKLNPEPENFQFRTKVGGSKSQSSSCSQNSGSSFPYRTEAKQINFTNNSLKDESCLAIEDRVIALKRTCNEAQMHSSYQEEAKLTSDKSIGQNLRDGMSFRVKATFAEENIRFSFQPNWGFKDLQQEIGRRFKIHDFKRFDFKYLDIDEELVLLTCDADLEECIDLLRSSQTNTIKITLQQASPQPSNFISLF